MTRLVRSLVVLAACVLLLGAVFVPTAASKSELSLSAAKGAQLKFSTTKLSAKAGVVTIRMANPSIMPHNVAIRGHGIDVKGKVVGHGGTSTVTVKLKKGRYTFYCSVPGHEAGGMKGTLTVS